MKRALFPGTFDPPSLGHLDIIARGSKLCDKLIIGIGTNIAKPEKNLFSEEERIALLQEITASLPNVEILSFTGLAIDFAKKNKIDFIIRGLRAYSDLETEFRMASANRKMGGVDTIFLMADERYSHISSTMIREFGHFQKRLHDFVPAQIEERVFAKISQSKR